jgi:hypothetical protein
MNPSKEMYQIRSHFTQGVGLHAVPRYRPLISDEITRLVKGLVDFEGDPEAPLNAYVSLCQGWLFTLTSSSAVGSIFIRMAYGNEIFEGHGQVLLNMNRKALRLLASGNSNFWLVDFFPLRNWFCSPDSVRAYLYPYSPVHSRMVSRCAFPKARTRIPADHGLYPLQTMGTGPR